MNYINFVHYIGLLVWLMFWLVIGFGFINILVHGYKPRDGIIVMILILCFFVYFTVDANTNLKRYTDELTDSTTSLTL